MQRKKCVPTSFVVFSLFSAFNTRHAGLVLSHSTEFFRGTWVRDAGAMLLIKTVLSASLAGSFISSSGSIGLLKHPRQKFGPASLPELRVSRIARRLRIVGRSSLFYKDANQHVARRVPRGNHQFSCDLIACWFRVGSPIQKRRLTLRPRKRLRLAPKVVRIMVDLCICHAFLRRLFLD